MKEFLYTMLVVVVVPGIYLGLPGLALYCAFNRELLPSVRIAVIFGCMMVIIIWTGTVSMNGDSREIRFYLSLIAICGAAVLVLLPVSDLIQEAIPSSQDLGSCTPERLRAMCEPHARWPQLVNFIVGQYSAAIPPMPKKLSVGDSIQLPRDIRISNKREWEEYAQRMTHIPQIFKFFMDAFYEMHYIAQEAHTSKETDGPFIIERAAPSVGAYLGRFLNVLWMQEAFDLNVCGDFRRMISSNMQFASIPYLDKRQVEAGEYFRAINFPGPTEALVRGYLRGTGLEGIWLEE